ncbi:hypothetical protein [Paenibacillus sp. FSL H8-0537]|uniref:hypothetical protein n=1 Tax=Paenibacillus sp. FSL H8-0537 TaxID=2921399 RepID=UPI00310177C1
MTSSTAAEKKRMGREHLLLSLPIRLQQYPVAATLGTVIPSKRSTLPLVSACLP